MGTSTKCKINTKLAPVKATYFFELGAVASLLPYLNVYMSTIGLTYSEMSIIYGIMPFVTAVLRMPVGMLADKLQRHRAVLLICCVFSGLFHGLLLLTPRAGGPIKLYSVCEAPVAVHCAGADSWLDVCPGNSTGLLCVNGNNCTSLAANTFSNASMCSIRCATNGNKCVESRNLHLYLDECTGDEAAESSTQLMFALDDLHAATVSYGSAKSDCSQFSLEYVRYDDTVFAGFSCPALSDIHIAGCRMTCEATTPEERREPCATFEAENNVTEPYQTTFWYFFMLFLLGQLFFAPIFSLIDAMVYDHLGAEAGKWGHQRLWGSVGFALCAAISGLMMDVFAELELGSDGKNFIYAFVAFAVLSMTGGLVVLFYKISPNITSTTMLKNLGELFSRFEVIVLFVCIFLYGAYTGLIEVFLYVRLADLGAPKLLMGICMVINCLPEIFILLFAGQIMKRLGNFVCLCIVFMAYAIRLIGYAFIQNPWHVLVFEPLHSITFGLMYAVVTSYGNDITPDGMHGTIQSIIGALYFGFGKGVGSISSGQVYSKFGAQSTFLGYGLSSLGFLLLYIVLYFLIIRKQHKKKPKQPVDATKVKEVEMKMLEAADDDKEDPDGAMVQNHLYPESA